VTASLPSVEAQVAALSAALSVRHRGLRCAWEGRRSLRLSVGVGGRARAVEVALDLVVLAPADALAAELERYLVAARGRRSVQGRGRPGTRSRPRPIRDPQPVGAREWLI